MTEIADLSPTDSSNTSISGFSTEGTIANMSTMDNVIQATLGMIGRWTSSDTIASATTTDIGAQSEAYLTVSGTTTITSFGTVRAGTIRYLRFSGALTLTYNATSLILPNAASITTAAGDVAAFVSEGSGNWRCLFYYRASGQPVVSPNYLRNRSVNGDKLVSQENGQTSGTTNGRYLSDQNFMSFVTSAGTITGVNVQTLSPAGGYRDRITITVADASLAAGEYLNYAETLEGSNVRDLKWGTSSAVAVVARLGFKGPAGTYAYRLGNSGATRSYVALFTISAGEANTDVVREFAIPGDTTGTWLATDGTVGIVRVITLAAGSTFQGTTGWQAGNILGTSAVSNGMATGGAVFEFFDEGFKADPNATGSYGPYEVGDVNAVFRPERYYKTDTFTQRVGAATAAGRPSTVWADFGLEMAKTPTMTLTASAAAVGPQASNASRKSVTITASSSLNDVAAISAYVANARL
jgi:hypothetical protein